jgi:hypothetical protein
MDGLLIPIIGVLVSVVLSFVCFVIPRLRRFLLAAPASPFLTSIVFLLGAFVLADMHPTREYGAAFIPNGKEHDPTKLDYGLWLLAVMDLCVEFCPSLWRPGANRYDTSECTSWSATRKLTFKT